MQTLGITVFRPFVQPDVAQRHLASALGAPEVRLRGPHEAQLYAHCAPAVVLVLNGQGLGSGTIIKATGDILTSAHVVTGSSQVGVIFKPANADAAISRKDLQRATVVKYDPETDLAVLHVDVGQRVLPIIELGTPEELQVGDDVSAIGHPTGDTWTYTRGLISQLRPHHEWRTNTEDITHRADVIQTQTPINPGNSGGPLLDDQGRLVGVNAYKTEDAENLNFAVSVTTVRRFLAGSAGPPTGFSASPKGERRKPVPPQGSPDDQRNSLSSYSPPAGCKPRVTARGHSDEGSATIYGVDLNCSGRMNAVVIDPDDTTQARRMLIDSQGNGKVDGVLYDPHRSRHWDQSEWDTNGSGKASLRGVHADGQINPSAFELISAD